MNDSFSLADFWEANVLTRGIWFGDMDACGLKFIFGGFKASWKLIGALLGDDDDVIDDGDETEDRVDKEAAGDIEVWIAPFCWAFVFWLGNEEALARLTSPFWFGLFGLEPLFCSWSKNSTSASFKPFSFRNSSMSKYSNLTPSFSPWNKSFLSQRFGPSNALP